MNVKDFRIGNFAQDQNGNLLQVCGLDESGKIDFKVVDRSKFPLPDGWQAEPILLTEEWLLKLGFEQPVNENCFIKNYGHQGELFIFNSKTPVAMANGVNPGEFYTQMPRNIRVVKYVHDVQNIFFCVSEGIDLVFDIN